MITLIIFLCLGSPFIIGGGIWWLRNLLFLMRAEETTGTVVDHVTSRTKNGSSSRAVVEFKSSDGQTVQFKEQWGSDNEGGGIEVLFILVFLLIARIFSKRKDDATAELETVKVVYDPYKPSRAYIKNFQSLHFVPLLLISIGACISILGIPVLSGYLMSIFSFLEKIIDGLPDWL